MALVPRASSGSELGKGVWWLPLPLTSPLLRPANPKALGQLVLMYWIPVAEKPWEQPFPLFGYVLSATWALSAFPRAPQDLRGRTALGFSNMATGGLPLSSPLLPSSHAATMMDLWGSSVGVFLLYL